MTIKLYNTRTRETELFKPINDKEITIYSCGPTVYNDLHIGNWSAYIYWDILVRTLRANNYQVKQVINITDVGHLTDDGDNGEDKLEVKASQEGNDAWSVAAKHTTSYLVGRDKLNLLEPYKFALATDYIPQQLEFVEKLNDKQMIYELKDGLYFDTTRFPRYADFAGLNLKEQQTGTRQIINSDKKQPQDFAVWKFSPQDKKRSMEWPTPLSLTLNSQTEKMGFPGWHLECSAIIMAELGETIDIHTGGIDHIPTHHTNELAQSESLTGLPLANYWLHNNHMKSDGVKISKSLDNGYTLDDLETRGFTPDDFKMFVLQSHYQNESNFTFENLQSASNRLNNWKKYAVIRHQSYQTLTTGEDKLTFFPEISLLREILNDNLNTPKALSFIDEIFSKIDNTHKEIDQSSFFELLKTIDELLGFKLIESTPDIDDETKSLILERRNYREASEWEKADQVRDELAKRGVAINDTSNTSYWYYI